MGAQLDQVRIAELFAGFGPVVVRRMFGGAGIFAGGVMIALVSDGAIYLKADASTIPNFEREGLGPFIYSAKSGKRAVMSYWRMPERLYDEPEELARWARQAHAVALSAATSGTKSARPKPPRRKTVVERAGPTNVRATVRRKK